MSCRVCVTRRVTLRRCPYVEAQAKRADDAEARLHSARETAAKALVANLERERDDLRRLVQLLVRSEPAAIERATGSRAVITSKAKPNGGFANMEAVAKG